MRGILSIVLVAALAAIARADLIVLDSNEHVYGVIVAEEEKRILISLEADPRQGVQPATRWIARADIRRIERGIPHPDTPTRTASKARPPDAPAKSQTDEWAARVRAAISAGPVTLPQTHTPIESNGECGMTADGRAIDPTRAQVVNKGLDALCLEVDLKSAATPGERCAALRPVSGVICWALAEVTQLTIDERRVPFVTLKVRSRNFTFGPLRFSPKCRNRTSLLPGTEVKVPVVVTIDREAGNEYLSSGAERRPKAPLRATVVEALILDENDDPAK